jgi:hypothetical protein
VAFSQQPVGQVRTEKSGSAGDKNAHGQRSMLQEIIQQFVSGVSGVSPASRVIAALTPLTTLTPLQAPTRPICGVCLAALGNLPAGPRSHT